jgi:hypothetical protein
MARTTGATRLDGGVEGLEDGLGVSRKPVYGDQHGLDRGRSCLAPLRHQRLDQTRIALGGYVTLEKQTRKDAHSRGHPHPAALGLAPDFVGLDLAQFDLTVADALGLDGLVVLTRPV